MTCRVREYYDFMDRYDLGLARIALAEKRPALTIGMNFYNSAGKGLSEDGETILGLLAPHFRRACNLTQALAEVEDRAALGEAWFQARAASLILDGKGNVIRVNAAGEALLALSDGLTVVKGRLLAATSRDRDRLDAEIAGALGISAPNASAGDFLLISRPSGLPAFAVSVVPLKQRAGRERVILTIAPTVPRLSPLGLQKAFGFTRSEALVAAALGEGRSPEEIADDRAVSLHTVRTQIKSLFQRLDVNSQSELVSRITAAALGARLLDSTARPH